MAILFNGINVSDVKFNGVAIDKVIYNGVTVFEKVSTPIREPESGEYYANVSPFYFWCQYVNAGAPYGNNIYVYFNSTYSPNVTSGLTNATSISDGTYTYYRGTLKKTNPKSIIYAIYRIKN